MSNEYRKILSSYFVNRDPIFNKLYQILLGLVIFLAPSNLFLKLYEGNSYVNGLQVDYLIPKLYLSDIPILLILSLWLLQSLLNAKLQITNVKQMLKAQSSKLIALCNSATLTLIISVFFLLTSNLLLSTNHIASLWYLAKIIELTLFTLFLKTQKKLLSNSANLLLVITVITLVTQSLLALYQYNTQHSLTNYYLTGETNLTNFAGLAKITINGAERTLPYGTTAHPNILAGLIVVYLIILSKNVSKLKAKSSQLAKVSFIALLLISLTALYSTHSLTAWLTLALFVASFALRALNLSPFLERNSSVAPTKHEKRGQALSTKINIQYSQLTTHNSQQKILILLAIILTPPLIHFMATNYPSNQSLIRRDYLNQAAWKMFLNNPLFGVGLNNFTTRVEEYSQTHEIVRFVQPVHNLPLLVLAENGIIGNLLLFLLIKKMFKVQSLKSKVQRKGSIPNTQYPILISLLPIILLDHYLLTNQTGMILLTFGFQLLLY